MERHTLTVVVVVVLPPVVLLGEPGLTPPLPPEYVPWEVGGLPAVLVPLAPPDPNLPGVVLPLPLPPFVPDGEMHFPALHV